MNRPHSPLRLGRAVLVVLIANCAAALAAPAPAWHPVHASELTVSTGIVFATGGPGLGTKSAEMRAVQQDRGRHAGSARLAFRFQGNSPTTKPLGSGLVRRQIGLKLRAADPCNLLYVMWRSYPDRVIEISRKSNPGLHTSQQCGNSGYSDLALIPEPAGVYRHHVLEADTRRTADGSLVLTVYADGRLVRKLALAPGTAGPDGPIGVRSDNGSYRFRLSAARAPAAM